MFYICSGDYVQIGIGIGVTAPVRRRIEERPRESRSRLGVAAFACAQHAEKDAEFGHPCNFSPGIERRNMRRNLMVGFAWLGSRTDDDDDCIHSG